MEAADGEKMSKARKPPALTSAGRQKVAAPEGEGGRKFGGADPVDIGFGCGEQVIGEETADHGQVSGVDGGLDQAIRGGDQQGGARRPADGHEAVDDHPGPGEIEGANVPANLETTARKGRDLPVFVPRLEHADSGPPSPAPFGPAFGDHQPGADPGVVLAG